MAHLHGKFDRESNSLEYFRLGIRSVHHSAGYRMGWRVHTAQWAYLMRHSCHDSHLFNGTTSAKRLLSGKKNRFVLQSISYLF
jgi:hypothetical protein